MTTLDLHIPRDPSTLRVQVEQRLRSAIGSGYFTPGQRLIERELCETMGVGRTSIREALRQLEAEGLVHTIPYRGPTVAKIDREGAHQLYEMLALLRPFAARLFAEKRDPADLRALTLAFEHNKLAVTGSPHEILEAKSAFHAAVTRGCQHMYLQQVLANLHGKIRLLGVPSIKAPGRIEASIAELGLVHDAIVAGDAKGAERAMRRHVEASAKATVSVMDEPPAA